MIRLVNSHSTARGITTNTLDFLKLNLVFVGPECDKTPNSSEYNLPFVK